MTRLKNGVKNGLILLGLLLSLLLLYGSWFNKYKGRNDCSEIYPNRPVDRLESRLGSSYRTETLSRLGSDLNFDAGTCPPNTLAEPSELPGSFQPLHNDCPALFIVGVRKGGSTSLIQYVSKHPDFSGPRLDRGAQAGETFYFDYYYRLGMSWRAYLHLFPSCVVHTGESTASYLTDCQVPKRIFKTCGNSTKVVMLLRDPVQRFFSDFQMRITEVEINLFAVTRHISSNAHFRNIVVSEIEGFTKRLPEMFHNSLTLDTNVSILHNLWSELMCKFGPALSMINEGLYYIHLMNWLCNFPPENILILNSEEFFKSTSKLLKQVFDFIGLKELNQSTYDDITSKKYNSRRKSIIPVYQTITTHDSEMLTEIFNPYNKALYKLLGWNQSATEWK